MILLIGTALSAALALLGGAMTADSVIKKRWRSVGLWSVGTVANLVCGIAGQIMIWSKL